MASATTIATLTPSLIFHGSKTLFRPLQQLPVSAIGERRRCIAIVAKATGESSDSSTSLSVVKSVQDAWDKPEDRLAIIGLGFAGVVGLWASTNIFTTVDKLPLIPSTLEFIGILFSSWFIYRYLLFKPDRQELLQIVNKSISDVLGQ